MMMSRSHIPVTNKAQGLW